MMSILYLNKETEMTQQEITILNLGQSLDDLANLDPRGYGVCKILYAASRPLAGKPLCMNAAEKLMDTIKKDDIVYILTGFVLRPYHKPETDGAISAVLLCRSLVKAFGTKPVIVCPADCRPAVEAMSACVGLDLQEDLDELASCPNAIGLVLFTKDAAKAASQADEILSQAKPSAVIAIEAPGCNADGVYHNAIGLEVTPLEAKMDVLFEKAQAMGILNIAIGDLGNEIGMGAIGDALNQNIPYAAKGGCNCGCGGGIAVKTKADTLITATVSDWGCYAMIAALAFLKEDPEILHTADLEEKALIIGTQNGLIDMGGEHIPAIDGFGLSINLPILSLMGELVKNTLALKETCKTWFQKVEELKFFEK